VKLEWNRNNWNWWGTLIVVSHASRACDSRIQSFFRRSGSVLWWRAGWLSPSCVADLSGSTEIRWSFYKRPF